MSQKQFKPSSKMRRIRDYTKIEWNENGQKISEENYKDGMLNGLTTVWYENGQKKHEKNFSDGRLNGLTITWNEDGQKSGEVNFINGIPSE